MRAFLSRACAAMLLLAASAGAHAAISCGVSSGGVNHAYDPTLGTTTVVAASFRVTCTRGLAGDPNSVNFSVLVNDGSNPQGVNNRATMGTNTIRYDVYRNGTCASKWKGGTAISGTLALPATGTFSVDVSFWMCMGSGIAAAAGTYVDSMTMTMNYGAGAGINTTGAIPVSIATPAICSVTAAPADLVFDYTAFGAAQNPSSPFSVTCTLHLPYTMTLDASAGTAAGLAYTLSMSSPNSTGTGAVQVHSVNGAMAAGQAGTCGAPLCTATQTRTLTLTY
jgi:spore coat protein U-like protein